MQTIDATWHTFEWHGRAIAWRRAGTGPPLVLCHGTPFSSHVWETYAAEAAADHTVYLWDMPGYGRSSKEAHHRVDLGVQGLALTALLQHWEVSEPTVVAHDFGGATALRAHLLHGCDYASLTLVNAVALRPWGSEFFRLVRDNASVFAALPPAMHRGILEAYVKGAVYRPFAAGALDRTVTPWLDDEGQAAFYAHIAQADERWTTEFEDLLPRVRCPASVIWGAEDTWLPVEHAYRLATAVGVAAPTVLPAAGHLVQFDAPELLAAALRGT